MEATIVYGFSRTIKHEEKLPVEEAFALIPKLYGYAFINIYYGDHLVYTTQGLAGFAWVCDDCPYNTTGKKVARQQYDAIYSR
jgi:hypothetical protein